MAQGYTKKIPIDYDVTLSANTDYLVPSQKAIKTYVDDLYGSLTGGSDHNKTFVQGGTNISTGGTEDQPTVNLDPTISLTQITVDSLFVNTAITNYGAFTVQGASSFQGTAGFSQAATFNNTATFNAVTDFGDNVIFYLTTEFNGTTTHNGLFNGSSIFGNSISATTFYSGSTDLSTLIGGGSDHNKTFVQGGSNINTGGTVDQPIINLNDSITLDEVLASNLSATTFYSGSTDLSTLIGGGSNHNKTYITPGSNITTGGTEDNYIISVSGNPSFSSATITDSLTLSYLTDTYIPYSDSGSLAGSGNLTWNSGTNTLATRVFTTSSNATIGNALGVVGTSSFSGAATFSGTFMKVVNEALLEGDVFISNFDSGLIPFTIASGQLDTSTSLKYENNILSATSINSSSVTATTFYSGSSVLSTLFADADADLVDVTSQGASYTLALSDRSSHIRMTGASASNLIVPTNASVAFPVGTSINLVQAGAGTVTVSGATGVTLYSFSGLTDLAGQYASASLTKIATNEWDLTGNLA